jgi:hypothetical protein
MNRFLWALPVLAFSAGAAGAATVIPFTVAAGEQDRRHVPVCVAIALPADLAGLKRARVVAADGDAPVAVGQLTKPGLVHESAAAGAGLVRRELHFILPALKAGETLRLKAVCDPDDRQAAGETFSWHEQAGEWSELRFGRRPVLRYVCPAYDPDPKKREATFKVYHHVYDPRGERLVTKGPGGLYTHHRGLFYGFRKVTYGDGIEVDIWHCTKDTHQEHGRFLDSEAGPVLGRHLVAVSWRGRDGKEFAREQREVTAYHVPGGTLIDWVSRLETAGGKVRLDGDPQHAGFHFRADNEVADRTSKETIFVRPDGADKPGATRNWPQDKGHVNLPWDAMSFVLGSQRYTVAYLDRPDNPKEARFSERNYGRFGSYFVREVTPDHPLTVRYRVWLQDGEMKPAEVAALDADFVRPPKATLAAK